MKELGLKLAAASTNAVLSSGRGETDRASDDYLVINNCGHQVIGNNDMTTSRRQGRKDYQMLYIWKGCGYFLPPDGAQSQRRLTDDKQTLRDRIRIAEGEIVIYKPHDPQIYTYRADDHCEAYWVHMTGSSVASLLELAGLADEFHFQVGQHTEIATLFQKIIMEIQRQQDQYELICQSGFLELLALIARHHRLQDSSAGICNRDLLLAVVDNMHNHYDEAHDNATYAAACNLSVYRFIHLFRQLTGLSPCAYQTRIRIDRACDLLVSTTLSISEVAVMVGYNNPLYFSRLFHKLTGHSPTAYKRRA